MITNPLIHIGYHKTGTTWLQNQLFISNNDVFEPLSLNSCGHSSIARHFVWETDNNNKRIYMLSPFDMNEKVIQSKLEEIQKKKDFTQKIPVISSERLSGNPHASGFDSSIIAQRLKNAFPHATILIIIRNQKDIYLSNYIQYLKVGGVHSLTKYLNIKYDGKRPGFSPHYFDYLMLVEEYFKLFGKDNVKVLPYEMFKKSPKLFFNQLGFFLNVSIDPKISSSTLKYHNVSNNKYLLYKLRWLNLLDQKTSLNSHSILSNRFSKRIASFLRNVYSIHITRKKNEKIEEKLNKEIEEFIGNRYYESNKKLSNKIDINLEEYGY
jgi:hypothetical protein